VATIFRTGKLRVAIYTNDHPPPHVHVVGPDREAKFELNCPDGPVRLVEQRGFRIPELNAVGAEIALRLSLCCRKWSAFHGKI